jgi:opacity protein-like surface antigen
MTSIPARAGEPVKQQAKGFYATIGVGASWSLNTEVSDSFLNQLNGGAAINGTIKDNGGFAGEIGGGYDFGDLRAELTYVYNNSSLNSLGLTDGAFSATINTSANISSSSLFASGYYDIPVKNSRFIPYIGGGLGYTNIRIGSISGDVSGLTLGSVGGNKSLFGYQAKIGVTYLATKTADVFLEGVYQGSPGFSIDTTSYGSLNQFGARLGARYRF